jgi:hypothetical protein
VSLPRTATRGGIRGRFKPVILSEA